MGAAARRLVLALAIASTAHAGRIELAVRDDRLTARLDAARIDDVLAALSRASGAAVRGRPTSARQVTADIDDVPLAIALPRILGAQSFTLEYGRDGAVAAITLGGAPAAAPPPSPRRLDDATPSPAGPASVPIVLGRPLARHGPAPLPAGLATALASANASLVTLLDAAAGAEDGALRTQAAQAVLGALERESGLRRIFLRALYRLDDAGIAALGSGEAGARFREILAYLAANTREPALQKKTAVFLDMLRPPADAPAS